MDFLRQSWWMLAWATDIAILHVRESPRCRASELAMKLIVVWTALFVITMSACVSRPGGDAAAVQPASVPNPTRAAEPQSNAARPTEKVAQVAPGPAQGTPAQISEYVRKVFQDRDGHFWFGTNDEGVCRYDGKSLTYFGVREGLAGRAVRGIAQDRAGAMWFATDGGVSRYERGAFTTFRLGPAAGDNEAWSLLLDKSDTLWVGTLTGVRRFDGTSFVPFNLPIAMIMSSGSLVGPGVVLDMAQDEAGTIWFGTDGAGLHKYDGKAFTSYTTTDGLGGNQVLGVYADRRGRIWVGTEGGGVTCIEDGVFRTFTSKDGLGSDRVWDALEDQAGNMWFSTLGAGACRFDGKAFKVFGAESGLTHSHVQSMYEARDGMLWFGCSGGLFRFDGRESFVNVTREGPWIVEPLGDFARFVGGSWKTTANTGTSMYDTWHWGPGRLSIRSMTEGEAANGAPWHVLTVYYWHPSRKEIRTLSVNPMWRGVSEGAITFDGTKAQGAAEMYQTVGRRELSLRWAFDGPDKYSDALFEKARGKVEMLAEWDRFRVPAAPPSKPPAVPMWAPAATPTKFLLPLQKLLGHAWEGKPEPDAVTPQSLSTLRTRTKFEYVPDADAIYGRVEIIGADGTPGHAMDLYLYHHTGAGVLRCLALTGRSADDVAVYEGDITPSDDGRAITIRLKRHTSAGETLMEDSVDFEPDGTMRQRVWTLDGQTRNGIADLRHSEGKK